MADSMKENNGSNGSKGSRGSNKGLVLALTFLIEWGVLFAPIPRIANLSFPDSLRLLIAFVLLFLLVYFWWAPNNLYFTTVKEGTVKVVMKAGARHKGLIQWTKRRLEPDGDVIKGEKDEFHLLGGFRYYGFWPIKYIYEYDFSWTNITQADEIVEHPQEHLDYVLLKEDVYWAKIEDAEDLKLLPLRVEVVLTIKIINPFKALFEVENWLEATINKIKPEVRNATTQANFETLIRSKNSIGERIFETKEMIEIRKYLEEEYGVKVRKLQVKDIKLQDEEYREATLKPWLAEQEAKSRIGETIKPLITAYAHFLGKKEKDVQEMFFSDERFKKEALEISLDLIRRRMSLDKNARVDIGVDGAQGTEKIFLNLLAAWQKLLTTAAKDNKKEEKTAKKMTPEEALKFLRGEDKEQ